MAARRIVNDHATPPKRLLSRQFANRYACRMTLDRSPQFTLKTLFAMTSGCALFFGYLHWTGRNALALAAATTLVLAFATIPLAFAASVAIDGCQPTVECWQPFVKRWKLTLALSFIAMLALWIAYLVAMKSN